MVRIRARLALALLALPAAARAGNCDTPETNGCVNADTYWPQVGPQRFATVAGAQTVAAGDVTFGIALGFQHRPVVLKLASPGSEGSERAVIENQLTASFLFGYALTDRFQLGAVVPVTVIQNGVGLAPITGGIGLRDTVARDLRFGAAFAIIPRARALDELADPTQRTSLGRLVALTARFDVSAPTGETAQQLATDRGAVFIPSLAADARFQRFYGALEVGARIRQTGDLLGARVGSQLSIGLGFGVDILPKELLSAGIEARMLPTFAEQQKLEGGAYVPSGASFIPAEWLASVRSAPLFGGDLGLMLAAGGALPLGDVPITQPAFRMIFSVVFAPLGRDSDGDGVDDRTDECPAERGLAPRGCPARPPPPPPAPDPTPPPAPAPAPDPPTPPPPSP